MGKRLQTQGYAVVEERRKRRRGRSWRAACGRLGWGKDIIIKVLAEVKGVMLTAPSFLVSDVTAPGDEIVTLQEIHEFWVCQSSSKLLVSVGGTPKQSRLHRLNFTAS